MKYFILIAFFSLSACAQKISWDCEQCNYKPYGGGYYKDYHIAKIREKIEAGRSDEYNQKVNSATDDETVDVRVIYFNAISDKN